MATSTFERPLVLTEKGVDNLIALTSKWEKSPPKPIPPVPDDLLVKGEDLSKIMKCLSHSEKCLNRQQMMKKPKKASQNG